MRGMWDVFCHVIDNHGDLGVCLRLARQLAARGESVRLWVDDASALAWMAPDLAQDRLQGVQCRPWAQAGDPDVLAGLSSSAVWIEAFGCELPASFVAHGVAQTTQRGLSPPAWINLEYLSAEPFVERAHGLPSPIMSGPARGWSKHFFYPGFTPRTGGLLREDKLLEQQAALDRDGHRHALCPHLAPSGRLISLFCYEPPGLPAFLSALRPADHLLVTPGRAQAALQACGASGVAGSTSLPHTDQAGFDRLLGSCDLNLVRGEDSLVRALWANQPLIWQIYPQDDNAHHAKLEAFLDWLDAPPSLRQAHAVWNGLADGDFPTLCNQHLGAWGECVSMARGRLLAQPDLLTQLTGFIASITPGGRRVDDIG
ncbi:MAG: hypothetical protein RL657_1772 [Pseudomonadota bacterium]